MERKSSTEKFGSEEQGLERKKKKNIYIYIYDKESCSKLDIDF
jgi:hypothetical protein